MPERTSANAQRPNSAAVLWAAWRQGLKDLQNAVLNPFPPGHVAQHEEPGSIANPTQREVYQTGHGEAPTRGASNTLATPAPSFVINASPETSMIGAPPPSAPEPAQPKPTTPEPTAQSPAPDPLDKARQASAEQAIEPSKDQGMAL